MLCWWFISSWVLLLQCVFGCGLCLCWVLPQDGLHYLVSLKSFWDDDASKMCSPLAFPWPALQLPPCWWHSRPGWLCCELALPLLRVQAQSCFPAGSAAGVSSADAREGEGIWGQWLVTMWSCWGLDPHGWVWYCLLSSNQISVQAAGSTNQEWQGMDLPWGWSPTPEEVQNVKAGSLRGTLTSGINALAEPTHLFCLCQKQHFYQLFMTAFP